MLLSFFFFFNDTATTEIYTLSLHDALPISPQSRRRAALPSPQRTRQLPGSPMRLRLSTRVIRDRKSTRLNSSHGYISYAVFCLKKKKKENLHGSHDLACGQELEQAGPQSGY